MSFSWYENNIKNISSFYDTEYYRVSNPISTGYTGFYFTLGVEVYNQTPVYYKQQPHPIYNTALINPFEVVKTFHVKHFDPSIELNTSIGQYDLYEFMCYVSGSTGMTVIESGHANKNIAHNHINQLGETFTYAKYIMDNSSGLFLNRLKVNKIDYGQRATLQCLNGVFNCDATYTSQVDNIFYTVFYNDSTWKSFRHPLSGTMLRPVQLTGDTLTACTNHKISIPTGPDNINGIINLYYMSSGVTPASFDMSTIVSGNYSNTGTQYLLDPITNAINYYVCTISGTTSWKRTSEWIEYEIDTPCKGLTNYRLAWLNHLGGYDYFNFKMKSERGIEIEKQEYRASAFAWDLNQMAYLRDEQKRVQTTYDLKGDWSYTVNTDWLSDAETAALTDLYYTVDAYLLVDDSWFPIQITNTSVAIKDNLPDQMSQYTVTFKANEGIRPSL